MRHHLMTATILLSVSAHAAFAAAPSHPLQALSASELALAVKILQSHDKFVAGSLFPNLTLNEPPKDEVTGFKPGRPFRREAFAVILDRKNNTTTEAVVDLKARKAVSWKPVADVQPMFLVDELTSAPEIVKKDPRFQAAMKKRGITDYDELQLDGWAPGTLNVTTAEGPRLVRVLAFYKGKSSNAYARPIEGLVAVVDMNARKVVRFDDGNIPISKDDGAYDEKAVAKAAGKLRPAVKPLKISQPEGPSFKVKDGEVVWQKWRFRYTMHSREGLVLHTVGYEDGGRVRPILYRASLSEMVVPYGDPDPVWAWRNAFDVGEYGVGKLAAPLEPKRDAPENAVFFDADFVDDFGKTYKIPRASALFERDGGLLWKHYDVIRGKNESRRARQLVLFFLATVGNYDYGISWIFHEDGAIEMQATASGIMLAKGVDPATKPCPCHGEKNGHFVSDTIIAPHHQHFFNFRLDFDVDGPKNSVLEMNTHAVASGKDNPFLNAIAMESTVFKSESEARRDLNLSTSRKWVVFNPEVKNELGQPTGFALLPADNSVPYAHPDSLVRKRAGFINHHFWATRFKSGEMSAGGDYPNQSRGGDGLEKWASDDESLENQDDVVWYTMALTHIPRPEEWPIMSATNIGFKLVPASFFSRNPALDVRK